MPVNCVERGALLLTDRMSNCHVRCVRGSTTHELKRSGVWSCGDRPAARGWSGALTPATCLRPSAVNRQHDIRTLMSEPWMKLARTYLLSSNHGELGAARALQDNRYM